MSAPNVNRFSRGNMKTWTPHPYQEEAIQDIIREEHRTMWFFPGDGKTSISLEAFRRLKESGVVKKALIIAPKEVAISTWPDELAKWDRFKDLTYTVLHGAKKEALLNNDTDLYLINFEGLKWLLKGSYTGTAKAKSIRQITTDSSYLHKLGVDMLIIDELSKCKSTGSMQTRLICKIAPSFKKRIGLTATPSPNTYLEVFPETKCLDLGATFGVSFTRYQRQYFYKIPETRLWELQNDAAREAIYQKLAPIVTQRKERQLNGLPVLTLTEVPVQLPPKVRKFYDSLEENFVAEFDKKEIDAFNAGVKTLKLRQIASGGIYHTKDSAKEKALQDFVDTGNIPRDNASRETVIVHDAKSQALSGLIEGLHGQPLLIFYAFNHDVDNIISVLGDVPVLNKSRDRVQLMQDWNAGKVPILLLHAKSAAHGLNLQESGGHVCWYTLEWSHEIHEQGIGRVWRQGNPAPETRVYYLLSKDTVDEHVLDTVKRKGDDQQKLFEGVKKYYEFLKAKKSKAIEGYKYGS
jgi:SNF2 family DNA or RNA helicase